VNNTSVAHVGLVTNTLSVGLLPAGNDEQVTIAYDIYRTDTKEGYTLSDGFRDTFSRVVPIEFVGVWYAHPRNVVAHILMIGTLQGLGFECRHYTIAHSPLRSEQQYHLHLSSCHGPR
jgi:hypothetical protein